MNTSVCNSKNVKIRNKYLFVVNMYIVFLVTKCVNISLHQKEWGCEDPTAFERVEE